MTGGGWRALVACLVLLSVSTARGQETSESRDSLAACNPDTAERLRFIQQRLEEGRTYATYWGRGWLGFYAIGTVFSSAQAATDKSSHKRADHTVSAVKALGGTIRLALIRPTARFGADPMLAVPATSEERCRERLAIGEDLLRTNAKQALSRYSWKRHFYNFAVNIGGGLIVAEAFDAPSRGLTSAIIGIMVGEAMTWSHPWRGTGDLEDYERQFAPVAMPKSPEVSLELIPIAGGAGVRVRF